jgi:hypothetical protein
MVTFNQGNTQVYSPFGSIVVEQRDRGFQYPRLSEVPEPAPAGAGNPARSEENAPVKVAA